MLNPLVSIVIPVFNGEKFLKEAIDSVLLQDYPNIELIVLDDGSTDKTSSIMHNYPESAFYRATHSNMGQAATLNRGWHMAKGKVLSYLSADDVLLPNAVSTAIEALDKSPDIVMVYGDYELIDINSKKIRDVVTADFDYKDLLENIVVQPGPGPFFYKKALNQVGGWNTFLRQIPDYEFWLRLALTGDFTRIPKKLARFRVHDDSQSFNSTSATKSDEIIDVIENFFSQPGIPNQIMLSKQSSISMSYIVAARFHLRAGRYALYWRRLFTGIKKNWRVIFKLRAWHLMTNAWLHLVRLPK